MRRFSWLLLACGVSACRPADDRLPTWRVTEDIRVGNLPEATDSASARYDLEVGLGGTMYLLIPQAREVRVYNPAGNLINTIKSKGATAPRPTALGTVGGYLWIYDAEARAVELVQGNGAHFQTVQLQKREAQDSGTVEFHTLLRDGSVIVRESQPGSSQLTAVRINPANGQRDVLARVSTGSHGILFSPLDGMIVTVDNVPASADSTGFRVTKLNLVGDTLFSISWRRAARKGDRPGPTAAFMAPDGSTFIGQGQPGKALRWNVFGVVGKPIAQFETPRGIDILAVGVKYIYGIDPADGGPSLKRFRLVNPT